MLQTDYEQMTRKELREYVLANRNDDQAFQVYMDKVDKEAVKTPISDEIASDPQKFAEFISRNK